MGRERGRGDWQWMCHTLLLSDKWNMELLTNKIGILLTCNLWLCQIEGERAFIYSLAQKNRVHMRRAERGGRRVLSHVWEFWWMKSWVTFWGRFRACCMQSMEMCARAYAWAWFIVVKKMTRKNEKSVAEERERENLDGERIRLLQV